MADVKLPLGGLNKDELKLAQKALSVLKAQILRAKVKETNDPDMQDLWDKRVAQLDALALRLASKDLF